jgi:hypothetical protein
MPHFQIKHRLTGAVLFEGQFDTMRLCLEAARDRGANLGGANLARANLARAYLGGANLDGANIDGAYLDGANLGGANLARANLARAYLGGANLDGANLARANLARANLGGAYLARANLGGAIIRPDITLNRGPVRRATRGDGYEFFLWDTSKGWFVQAGCRWFTFEEGWQHWHDTRGGTPLGDESIDILTMFSLTLDREGVS